MVPLSAALTLAIGLGLTTCLVPPDKWPGGRLLRLTFGIPIGIGVCSVTYFFALITGFPHLVIELALLAAALLLWGLRAANAVSAAPGSRGPILVRPQAHERTFRLAFFSLAAADAVIFAMWSARWPRGGWDGWAIWNQRARFLNEAGNSWRDAFSPALSWSHTDYPLLVPAFLARAWSDLGNETTLIPIFVSGLFAVAVVALLVLALIGLQAQAHAFAAGVLLLATPSLVQVAASQYVDVTFSYFVLATLVLRCFSDGLPSPGRWLALSGVTAGLAAWTKNEGLLLVAAVAVALAVTSDRRVLVRRMGAFLGGAGPFLLTILYFKQSVVVSGGFLAQHITPTVTENLLDVHRYVLVTEALAVRLWRFGSPLVSPVVFLLGYLLCSGVKMPRGQSRIVIATGLTLLLMAAGDFAIFIVTSDGLEWLLATALDRLCLQLWPSTIFALMFCARAVGRDEPVADLRP